MTDLRPTVLAVDIGGTTMKGAVVTDDGTVLVERTLVTSVSHVTDAVVDLLRQLHAEALEHKCTVIAAGVVVPGMVDEVGGVVRYASNLELRDVPLRDIVASALKLPVALGHDVRAAGLAEQLIGAGRNVDDFVLIPIGTGVAAALIAASGVVTGATGAAGEFGHIPVVREGEPCVCGQRGCLEVYVSGAGVARRYAAFGGAELSSREIVTRLGTDPIADQVWADAIGVLAQGLNTMTLLLDPGLIVLGGGFSHAGDALFVPLAEQMAEGLAWRKAPHVVRSQLGSDAGRKGAAILAFCAADHQLRIDSWATPLGTTS